MGLTSSVFSLHCKPLQLSISTPSYSCPFNKLVFIHIMSCMSAYSNAGPKQIRNLSIELSDQLNADPKAIHILKKVLMSLYGLDNKPEFLIF